MTWVSKQYKLLVLYITLHTFIPAGCQSDKQKSIRPCSTEKHQMNISTVSTLCMEWRKKKKHSLKTCADVKEKQTKQETLYGEKLAHP